MSTKQKIGTVELVGELHRAEGLPITFRPRHSEIAVDLLLGIPPLLVSDDHHRPLVKPRHPGHDRRVLAETAVAFDLEEVIEQVLDEIESVRTLRMPRDEHFLPRRQSRVDIPPHVVELLLQARDLTLLLGVRGIAGESFDFPLQRKQRRLELQGFYRHTGQFSRIEAQGREEKKNAGS